MLSYLTGGNQVISFLDGVVEHRPVSLPLISNILQSLLMFLPLILLLFQIPVFFQVSREVVHLNDLSILNLNDVVLEGFDLLLQTKNLVSDSASLSPTQHPSLP